MKLLKSEFFRNVLTLMTGTSIAQFIPFLLSPILTRIYSPDDFGLLTLFVSIITIAGVAVNGKYEQAIVLPKDDNDGINLFFLCLILSTSVSVILLIIVVLFNTSIGRLLGDERIGPWLYLVPLSLFFFGLYSTLNFLNTRLKTYATISKAKVTKATSMGGIQVALGQIGFLSGGLIVGQFFSYMLGNTMMLRPILKRFDLRKIFSMNRIKSLSLKYLDFPKFLLPSAILNVVSQNAINLLITVWYSTTILGFFGLTYRILGMPIMLLGKSYQQVFFQQSTIYYNKGESIRPLFTKALKQLSFVSVLVFSIFFLFAENLFSFFFGSDWGVAGRYASTLSPLFACRFVSTSLSIVVVVVKRQKIALLFNVILFLCTICIFLVGQVFSIDFEDLLRLYSLALSVLYLFFLIFYYKMINQKPIC